MVKVIAFDMGKKNFSYWVEDIVEGDYGTDLINSKTVTFDNTDLTQGETTDHLRNMITFLDGLADLLSTVDKVLIEQQMNFGRFRSNPMAVRMQHHCETYFMMRYPRMQVEIYPAYHKTQRFSAGKMTKPQRKKWVIEKAIEILSNRGDDNSLDTIQKMRKRDDVCDCFLMCLSSCMHDLRKSSRTNTK